MKSEKHTEKQQKTADSTQISHFDLVFHTVEGRPTMYILCFGGVWWCMHVYMVHIYVPLIVHAYGACMCMW